MKKWRSLPLSKEEEERVVDVEDEICDDESFQRTLADKLWLESSFNARPFKSTMINAWKLKNTMEIRDMRKIFSCSSLQQRGNLNSS